MGELSLAQPRKSAAVILLRESQSGFQAYSPSSFFLANSASLVLG